VGGLDVSRLERRPAEDVWSPGETLEHLRLTESSIVRVLRKLIRDCDLDQMGKETERSSILGTLDQFRLLEVVRRVPAPAFVQPAPRADGRAALLALGQSRRELLDVMGQADGWAVGQLNFPHPILGPLNFYQWLLFVGQHEARHTRLIQKALALP
jgi:hypothetical protein